jgi:hypothetical protein
MHFMKSIALITLLVHTLPIIGADVITITNPVDSAMVSGSPLLIDGTSSQASFTVRLAINTTVIGSTTTDGIGDWNFSYPLLANGSYTVTADLLDGSFQVLATDTNSFSVGSSEAITIFSPFEDENIVLSTTMASGIASLASTQVDLYIDNVLAGTTTTDSNGLWQIPFILPSNGSHDLQVYLIVSGNPVANTSITVIGKIPIILPALGTQITVIAGTVPTTGSGTGLGYSYSVTGITATITFDTSFANTPTVLTTALSSINSAATTTISSVSTSQAVIEFSAGTDEVHFAAMTLTQ